ncbi:M24 family metallopeptidase [Nocardia nova]|uniref:M24 family metallopeptidase n=1 Tax=Nocardia nova TaxID=37330 RepID=UPI0033F69A7B
MVESIQSRYPRVHGFELSSAERDRRWAAARAEMKARGLSALVISGFHSVLYEGQAGLRWFTNLDIEGYLVFPLEGEPVHFGFTPKPKVSRLAGCWVPDARSGFPSFALSIADVLREGGVTSGKVGVLSIGGVFGEYAGFPYATLAALQSEIPEIGFEDAIDWFSQLRKIKSAEEIRCYEIGGEIAEDVFDAVYETAREGVPDAEIRAAISAARIRRGCEPHSTTFYSQGKDTSPILESGLLTEPGYATPLEQGDIITAEITMRVNGYEIEFNQTWVLGEADAELERMFEVWQAAFEAGIATLRPGIDQKQLQAAMQAPLDEAGFTWFYPFFHGSGLLDEPPAANVRVSNFADGREIERPYAPMVFEENMVLIFEPSVVTTRRWGDDETLPWTPQRGFSMGCPVVVTADGCRPLVGDWWKPGVIRLPV